MSVSSVDLNLDARLAEPIEVAIYYAVSEALANALKHANASEVRVNIHTAGHPSRTLRCLKRAGIDPAPGSGSPPSARDIDEINPLSHNPDHEGM
jgi:anti-sigma regulatory factor (Ser/Thr protein kinase)